MMADILPIILDMDPGVDDAFGLILAMRSPEVEIVGLSVVCGNVPLASGVRNACQVLELVECSDVPVFSGADRPLGRDPLHAIEVHGSSGLGAASLPEPVLPVRSGAAGFLTDRIAARPGEVVIVATGPLTNLAMAEACAPGLLRRARRIVLMGGSLEAAGNVTPTSEFNFHADPHAARTVLRSGAHITLVPLEATCMLQLDPITIAKRADRGSKISRFCAAAAQSALEFELRCYGREGFFLHDPLAVALAMDPGLGTTEKRWVDVETQGDLTTGQLVVDRRGLLDVKQRLGVAVDCVIHIDAVRVLSLFIDRVLV